MKLSELMTILFRNGPITTTNPYLPDYNIYGEYLERYKDDLLKCEEFSEVLDITFVKTPQIEGNVEPTEVKSYMVKDGMKLKGHVVLYSITLTPEVYDPSYRYQSVKDGASIGPTIYDMKQFIPLKYISLEFSPELAQDSSSFPDSVTQFKQQLHETLDKVLNNPNEYQVKGYRGIMIRGLFDSKEILVDSPNSKVIL
jgi:hypothetical protein